MAVSLKKALASYNKTKKQYDKVQKTKQKEELQRKKEAVQTNRQIQKQVGKNPVGRALMGAVYGFNTGLAPASYSKKAADLGYKAYTPTAAAAERGDTTKKTAAFNQSLESSKSYQRGNMAGNAAATALSFIMGGGITKGLASKALKTKVGQSATGKISERLVRKAMADKAGKTLTRKALARMVQSTRRPVTETALRTAAQNLTAKVSENVAQDVAGDLTIGLYRDLAQARSQGVDLKDPVQAAKYLGKQAAWNTAIGTVTNGVMPVASAIRKSRMPIPEAQKVVATRNALGEASDILSPKLKGMKASRKLSKSDNLTLATVKNAMDDADYVGEVRKHGINGKSVRQLAAEEHRSIADIISEDYSKRRGVALENMRKIKRRALGIDEPEVPKSTVQSVDNTVPAKVSNELSANETTQLTPEDVVRRYQQSQQAVQPQTTQTVPPQTQPVQTQPNQPVTTQAGTPMNITAENGTVGRAAAESEAIRPDTTGAIDPTMGGKRTGEMAKESQAAKTVANQSGNTVKEVKEVDDYLSETNTGKTFSETNADALDHARQRLDEDGLEKSSVYMRRKYEKGEMFTNEDHAENVIAMERWRDIERKATEAGDIEGAKVAVKMRDELASIEVAELSETGKALQSARLFNTMSPEGRVSSIQMTIKKIEKARGVKGIKVDDDLLDQLRDATDEKAQQAIKDKIAVQIWDQVPANLTEKLAAWRYMSMLMNPRTHVRNFAGNTIFMPVKGVKNLVANGLEHIFYGGKARSKAILNPASGQDRELLKFAEQKWNDVAETFLRGSEKYDLGLQRAEGSRIFKNRLIQKASDLNSLALNKEDEWFAKYAYAHSYAQYMKANKIDIKSATKKQLKAAQDYAWDEALNSTYREANVLAEFINKARRGSRLSMRDIRLADSKGKAILNKATGTLADALVPFAKTPANIMKNGVWYSPVGIVRGLGKMATAKTVQQQIKALDAFAQGLTGSGIMALGYFASKNGLVTGSIPTGYNTPEQMKGTYDKDRGIQEYAIGDHTIKKADLFDLITADEAEKNKQTKSMTVDWAVPAAMPFFQGVELYNAIKETMSPDATAQDKFETFGRILTNMGKLTDPVLNLSMLSSVENAFDTYTSSGDSSKAVTKFATKSAQSRLGQYVPTALGQITKSFVDENTKSASPMNSDSLGTWEAFGRQQMNKIPGLSQFNADKSDAFGNKLDHKETTRDKFMAYAKNALSPAVIKDVRDTGVDKEIQRLVDSGQSPKGLYPEVQRKSFIASAFEDSKFDIGAKDVARYNEVHGQAAMKGLEELFKTNKYKNASTAEKVEMIGGVYKDATAQAKKDLAMRKGVSERDYALSLLSEQQKKKFKKNEKELKKLGINSQKYVQIRDTTYKLDNENADKYDTAMFVAKTLAATEHGVKNYEQASYATEANKSTWIKTYNLAKRGYTAKQVVKFVLTDEEKEKCSTPNSAGSLQLDRNKLIKYIDSMNISRQEKWARFETNRSGQRWFTNPF